MSCLRQDMKGHHGDKTIYSQRGLAHTDGQLEGAACFQTIKQMSFDSIKNTDRAVSGYESLQQTRETKTGTQCHVTQWYHYLIELTTFTDL